MLRINYRFARGALAAAGLGDRPYAAHPVLCRLRAGSRVVSHLGDNWRGDAGGRWNLHWLVETEV